MKLHQDHQEFRNPRVFYPDPKAVELDRVMVNLFALLTTDGHEIVTGRSRMTVSAQKVAFQAEEFRKLDGNDVPETELEAIRGWLDADVFDVVNRGKGEAVAAIASLRPLHLDAAKFRVAKQCRDYNVADHLYACLSHGDASTLKDLKAFLDRGRKGADGRYADAGGLDLETLAVLKIAHRLNDLYKKGDKVVAKHKPICIGQARILCDDVQRILAYEHSVPRAVLIEYLKAIMGLHTGLFTLRIARQLAGWVQDRGPHPACRQCPVNGATAQPFEGCPYGLRFPVDMSGSVRGRSAQLAQTSVAAELDRMTDLIRSLFTINQLLKYAEATRRHDPAGNPIDTPEAAVDILADPPTDFEAWFAFRLDEVRRHNEHLDESIAPEDQAILNLDLPAFDRFIELITHVRHKHHRDYLTQMLDKVFMKNTDHGALIQGKSAAHPRQWFLGPRLLEVFVQLAVLRWDEVGGRKRFHTRPILIDDFMSWLEGRYGFALGDPAAAETPADLAAHRENVTHLKRTLREIGFFEDLSDAFNAQTIRPRYAIAEELA